MGTPKLEMWAVIYRTVAGTECIQSASVRRTKSESWAAYCQAIGLDDHTMPQSGSDRLRLARVLVTEGL